MIPEYRSYTEKDFEPNYVAYTFWGMMCLVVGVFIGLLAMAIYTS